MKQFVVFLICLLSAVFVKAQNVGIGISNPVSKLHVKGTGSGTQIVLEENAGSILRLSNEGSGTGPYLGTTTNHPLSFVTNNAARVTITGNGLIGIGETSPIVPLNFASTLGNKISLWGNGFYHFGLGIQGGLFQLYTANNTDDFTFGYGNSIFFTENMRIKGNGKVGIGTNAPEELLSVGAGAVVDQNNNNTGTSANILRFGSTSGEGVGSNRNAGTNQYGLDFYTDNARRMTIDQSGNVAIGQPSPATVSGNLQVNAALVVHPESGGTFGLTYTVPSANSYFKVNTTHIPGQVNVTVQNGTTTGQILMIECNSTPPYGFNIIAGSNIKLSSSPINMDENDILSLIWNGSKWLETGRSLN